jgi:serine/threonine protein kinase/Tol biopolymer transport system component
MADQLVGHHFGGYEILEEIGRGGMAVVYRARQISMDRIVAVKVLPRQFVHDQTFRARFEREVSIVAKLQHRAIVPVHDYGEVDELPFIVMRYMDAGSVDDLLGHGPLPPPQVERIVRQIADGLDYAHTKGVFHRDLKPSNILLDETGDAYLTDFGIARLAGGSAITTEGVVGTPAYMSPEQAQGLKLDGRSDVYGLAVVTFEMLTGRRPYEADTPYGIAVMHVTAPVPSARDYNPTLSETIDNVLQRGLAKNRAERFQTSAEFAAGLSRAIHATADEIAETTAQTKPVDLAEAHRRLEEADQVYVSAPVRGGAAPGNSAPAEADAHDALRSDSQPTPPSSARVRSVPVFGGAGRGGNSGSFGQAVPLSRLRRRGAQPRPWWVNVLIGGIVGLIIFAVLIAVAVTLFSTSPPAEVPTETVTATPPSSGAEVTVIPGLGPLHPAAVAMTATAQAAPTQDPLEALSENGGQIVFYATRDGEDSELYLLDLASGLEKPLTDNEAADIYPAVSPDGTRVAFMSDRDGDFDIYVLPLNCLDNGGGAADCEAATTALTDNDFEDRDPAWTPDSERVVFASDTGFDGRHDLYRVAATGGAAEPLTTDEMSDGHPSVSPNGRYIAFQSWEADNPETGAIRRLDLNTGDMITLYDGEGSDWAPAYNPNGDTIAFLRRGEGRAALWIMASNGEDARLVYDGPGYDWAATWSPDGRLLAFANDASGEQEVYLIPPVGGEPVKITTGGGEYPSWVP